MTESLLEKPNPEAVPATNQPLNWIEQDPLLREMWLRHEKPEKIAADLGRTVAAIMTRAARLGLPRRAAPGRKPGYKRKEGVRKASALFARRKDSFDKKTSQDIEEAAPVKLVRICLMCLNRFPSEGRHNRICPNCKGSAEYAAGSSIPDTFKEA